MFRKKMVAKEALREPINDIGPMKIPSLWKANIVVRRMCICEPMEVKWIVGICFVRKMFY